MTSLNHLNRQKGMLIKSFMQYSIRGYWVQAKLFISYQTTWRSHRCNKKNAVQTTTTVYEGMTVALFRSGRLQYISFGWPNSHSMYRCWSQLLAKATDDDVHIAARRNRVRVSNLNLKGSRGGLSSMWSWHAWILVHFQIISGGWRPGAHWG
jgi:hypothetical protein